MPAHRPAVPIVLDIGTLTSVRREVGSRADDWRAAWRLHGPGPVSEFDQRLGRAEELESLGRWLDERVGEADRALSLSERADVTEAGRLAPEVAS